VRRAAATVVAALALLPGAPARAADAPAFKIDVAHTGYSPERLGKRLRVAWSRPFEGRITYPVVARGRVFVSHAQGIVALNARTGAVLWTTSARPGRTAPRLAVVGTRLVWSESHGHVGAYDARSGRSLWEYRLEGVAPNTLCAAPVARADVMFVGCSRPGPGMHAIAAADGRLLWRSPGEIQSVAALVGDRVVTMGESCGDAAARDATSGTVTWTPQIDGFCERFGRTPVVYRDRVYLGDMWPSEVPDPVVELATGGLVAATLSHATPAFRGDLGFFLYERGLRAESVTTGQVRWRFAGDGRLLGSPLVVRGRVVATSQSGTVFVVDRSTGRLRQRLRAGGEGDFWTEESAPVFGLSAGAGRLFVPARGRLVAYR
jgi:outer membrane protein assembly factor BamB